jgi:hypothetical protein
MLDLPGAVRRAKSARARPARAADSTSFRKDLTMVRVFSAFCLVLGSALAAAAPVRAVDIEKLLPKETDMVISVNVRQMLDSPVVKTHALDLIKTALKHNKELQEVIQEFGIDLLADVNRVTLGAGVEDITNPKGMAILEGRFDLRKIGNAMDNLVQKAPKQYSRDKVDGKTVYKIAPPDQTPPFYVATIDATLMVSSTSKEFLGAAFDAVNGTRAPEIKKEVSALLAKADSKASLFMVAYLKGRLDSVPLVADPKMKKVVEQVQSLAIEVKAETDINFEVAIESTTAEDAGKLKELVSGGLEFGKIMIKNATAGQPSLQPLVGLVGSMAVSQREKSVVVKGKLTGDGLEQMLKK